MEELTAGLLFNDTMVMIAGGGGVGGGGANQKTATVASPGANGHDVEFSSPSPCYSSYEQGTSSNVSSRSSISSSCSPAYYANQLPPELFTEFNEFTAFELGTGGSESGSGSSSGVVGGGGDTEPFLHHHHHHHHHHHGSDEEERSYMEELISSDLSSDEDKFLETIRYGGGAGVVHFSNDLLSEEELVNTIQTYGDVKVVQVDSGDVVVSDEVPPEIAEGVGVERVFEVVSDNGAIPTHDAAVTQVHEHKARGGPTQGATPGGGAAKKRKASVGTTKTVKRQTLIIQQSPTQQHQFVHHQQPREKKHKNPPQQRVFEDEIIIETNTGELITSDFGSPSPGSPQQQQHGHNGDGTSFQELKLSEEEKRLLMKEGISLPTHYPLTKLEERELKRIRRKIRNKISAQDSRKRKKEFLDRLQQKLQEVEDEKSNLAKRCRSLESINTKLNAQVKRLQQALASATSSVQNSVQQHQQKQTVVPAATTLLVLILSLALVVLPTSLDKNHMGGGENANELISLLNRSNNEMAKDQQAGRGVLGQPHNHVRSSDGSKVKSRAMVGENEDEMDDEDMMDVRELIGKMKTMLRNKRKRSSSSGEDGLLFGVKRSRLEASGRGNNNIRSLVRAMNRVDSEDGWYASSDEDGAGDKLTNLGDHVLIGKGSAARFGDRGGRRFERTHAFHIVDDVEVD